MNRSDPPEAGGFDASHPRAGCRSCQAGAYALRWSAERAPRPRIMQWGRLAAPIVYAASSRPSPTQDNDAGHARALERNLSAIIQVLDYIEADVEPMVPRVAIDLRRASAQLRVLVCLATGEEPPDSGGSNTPRSLDGTSA